MANYTTNYTTDGFNDTTPNLPKTPLHEDISKDFGLFFLCLHNIHRYLASFVFM